MAGFFSRRKGKDGPAAKVTKKQKGVQQQNEEAPPKPQWVDAWTRKTVEPEEVQELLRGCTLELKSRALDMPFLLLPFRPTSDPSAARSFIRHFFDSSQNLYGEGLAHELRLTEPMVLCSVVKWCWSRLPGGVVSWEAYELFKVGETGSNMARDSFATFIPLSVESDARTRIIFDFFDLLSAIAAHGKTNGLGGRKLSRLAGWWAFEHVDNGSGFEGGYRSWARAADAASHLFFAYLRSLSPTSFKGMSGISTLPRSLQVLVQETEYPPTRPSLLQSTTTKVVMIVNSVSPTPFSLLRRANHFQYRDEDRALQKFSEYEDPVKALTDECRRVLRSISSANQSQISNSKDSTGLKDASWSRFEDIGFSGGFDEAEDDDEESHFKKRAPQGLRTAPQSKNVSGGRPTTPSWADFLSSGFVDETKNGPPPLLLPPDQVLPPIDTRSKSSQSHGPRLESDKNLEPGELASITRFDLDDSFWWVWMSSLAGEEPAERKAAFGRCALVETVIRGGRWLVMEEMVQGAAPQPDPDAYIAEKKSFWGRSKKSKTAVQRSKSTGKNALENGLDVGSFANGTHSLGPSKTSIGPDQHARIQAAALQLQQKQRQKDQELLGVRRGRNDSDMISNKTSSVFTLQPVIKSAASPAMKWANQYDKDAIREAYLANSNHGRGIGDATMQSNGNSRSQATLSPLSPPPMERVASAASRNRDLPSLPHEASSPATPSQGPPIADPENVVEEDWEVVNHHAPPQDHSIDLPRPSVDQGGNSPESMKLGKNKKKEGGGAGFRKMFGRGKKEAKAPPSASQNPNGGQNAVSAGKNSLGRRLSGLGRKKSSSMKSPVSDSYSPGFQQSQSQASMAPTPVLKSEDDAAHVTSPNQNFERSYEPSVQDSLSRVDTNDAREANHAFSSFDQGPLEDVPAFIPEDSPRDSEESDDAVPSPIVDNKIDDGAELNKSVSPVIGDRWAQIRKNAADRAARQSEEQSRGGYSAKTDGDDGETSGEETIESRVARIKARVAELTGNMENGSTAPSRR